MAKAVDVAISSEARERSVASHGLAAVNWKEVAVLGGSGGVGGLFSWLYLHVTGEESSLPWWQGLPSYVFLGAGAAFLGIFVLANSDTRMFLRTLGFAVLCGFSWRPVFDAGRALIDQKSQESEVKQRSEQTGEAVARLDAAAPGTAGAEVMKEGLDQVAETSANLIAQSSIARSPRVREEARSQVIKAVGAIEGAAVRTAQRPDDSKVAVNKLFVLGKEASKREDPRIFKSVAASLRKLSASPELDAAVKKHAAAKYRELTQR